MANIEEMKDDRKGELMHEISEKLLALLSLVTEHPWKPL